ncbi:sigma-54 interaction domain-containing protein [Marinobacter alexandrii]|uniref:sigma-54 interaction domain-containing protein n=1 Tax=Marinobacter alexandrii TaxID=2570351 RepID=UPI0011083AD7|nr:sigma 54-interacting transcriptional regulator [Marinobacter alexandrii]
MGAINEKLTVSESTNSKSVAQLQPFSADSFDFPTNPSGVIGESEALRSTLDRVRAVARTPVTALILGESGVGKELIAKAIHDASARSAKPFVKVNCASVPQELFESEFFGHVRGSFTGAHRNRAGRFELADGGTLFLDEIGEIPMHLQAKLLRVLQEGQYEPVGNETTQTVDVRVVAATNRNLLQAVALGEFREDLYYRLSVFPVEVPPLRDRKEDIVALATYFLELTCKAHGRPLLKLDRAQQSQLQKQEWPGNVRELRNLIERAVILSDPDHLNLTEAFSTNPQEASRVSETGDWYANRFVTEAEWQRSYRDNIVAALDASNWKISGRGGAAQLLGMNASTLRGRIKSLKIETPRSCHEWA